MGIRGNESADQAAKEALNLEVTDMFIPHSDYKESMNKYVVALWREYWSYQRDNKLFRIESTTCVHVMRVFNKINGFDIALMSLFKDASIRLRIFNSMVSTCFLPLVFS